jgi:hypothetical protein
VPVVGVLWPLPRRHAEAERDVIYQIYFFASYRGNLQGGEVGSRFKKEE